MADGKPQLVIGRVVSMEHGRPTVSVPVGHTPLKPEVVALIAAARKFRDHPSDVNTEALKQAAMELRE